MTLFLYGAGQLEIWTGPTLAGAGRDARHRVAWPVQSSAAQRLQGPACSRPTLLPYTTFLGTTPWLLRLGLSFSILSY